MNDANDDMDDYAEVSPDEARRDARLGEMSFARVWNLAIGVVVVSVIVGLFVTEWRVTLGLALGGGLSLLNHKLLQSSVSQIFATADEKGLRPRVRIGAYVWRYFAIGLCVWIACYFNLVSITATLLGLCAFIPALFIEALIQIFLSFKREGKS